MPELVFEIWCDSGEQSMSQVGQEADKFRLATMPSAMLVHTFTATSDFDAFQKNYDWNGYGIWRPEPDWTEHLFTHEEAVVQQAYIAKRTFA